MRQNEVSSHAAELKVTDRTDSDEVYYCSEQPSILKPAQAASKSEWSNFEKHSEVCTRAEHIYA